MKKVAINEFYEIISDPITLGIKEQFVVQHANLPEVNNEFSVTLRLKLKSHSSDWATVFHKGSECGIRTPGFYLTANKSKLCARFSGNWNNDVGLADFDDGLLLNKWYHLTYTLSDSEKRLDVYINGEWSGFYSIQNVKTQRVIFNDGPLYIGQAPSAPGFDGEIGNFRYFNWRLSANEAMKDYLSQWRC